MKYRAKYHEPALLNVQLSLRCTFWICVLILKQRSFNSRLQRLHIT